MTARPKISLTTFKESLSEAYRALFSGDPAKSPELLRWRFRANPHGESKFVIANDGDRVVGLIALVPTRLRNAPGGSLGYQAIDTSVDASCRGQGLFLKMGSLAQDPTQLRGKLLWGFPNASSAPAWYGHLGWTNFGAVPLLVRPLRSGLLFGLVYRKLRSIDVRLIRTRQAPTRVQTNKARLCAQFDSLWQRVAPDFGIAVDRSGEWMRWRLVDKPGADYRCTGIESDLGELEAFAAVKIADKHGSRLCYVMEAMCLPGSVAELAELLLAELTNAARDGAEMALAWCPPTAPNYRAYRKAGFVPLPPLLRPIEINFGARALVPETAEASAPGARWYVSFLDSDTN